jgi:predicted DNA-binding transcriptional regulator AlpA
MIRKVDERPAQSFDHHSSGSPSSNDRYLTAAEVRQRYGNCTDVTIWRWIRDPRVAFPSPVKLGAGGLNYWWLPTLREWETRRSEKQVVTRAPGGRHRRPEASA